MRVVKVTGPVAERAAALRRQQGPTAGPGNNVSTGWMQWVDVLLVYLPDSTRLVKFSCRFDIKILIASYKPQSPVTKLRHQASVSIRVQSQSELFSRRQQQSGQPPHLASRIHLDLPSDARLRRARSQIYEFRWGLVKAEELNSRVVWREAAPMTAIRQVLRSPTTVA